MDASDVRVAQGDRTLVELAIRALVDTYSDRPDGEPSGDSLRAMVETATKALRGRIELPPDEISAVLEAASARPSYAAGFEYSRRQVARWFEVPPDEFDQASASDLHPEVLFRHIYYERKLQEWFQEWGYEVTIGEELEGIEGVDFIPDVFAELDTLHGNFSVAATLFCSKPTNTWRVLGMLENIEAYALKGSEFGERDVYLMITPFKFGEQSSNHIRIQSRQEDYYVVAVEGNDLEDLEHASTLQGRKERLQELIAAVARSKSSEAF